jgi:hypothetical protein
MEARISITTTDGTVYEGTAVLTSPDKAPKASSATKATAKMASPKLNDLQFTLPIRPFMKKYGAGLSGSKRLVLLVAHLVKGDIESSVETSAVQKLWSKMSALMGGAYNPAHASRARDNGWIDSPKAGTLTLLSGWKEVL